jgi:hypothetical protein
MVYRRDVAPQRPCYGCFQASALATEQFLTDWAEKSPKEIVMLNLIQDLQKFGFSVSDGDSASGCGMTNRGFFGQ